MKHSVDQARLAHIGEISDTIAHDLNNFLQTALFVVQESNSLESQNRKFLEHALNGMTDLVRRLRSYYGNESSQRRVVRLADILGFLEKVVILRRNRLHPIRLITDFEAIGTEQVLVNEGELTSAILNLVINSMEALADTDRPCLELRAARLGSHILITIIDNGPGIPGALLPSLFVENVSTKGEHRGHGLTSARNIIEAHGGSLLYDATQPGAHFRINLPLHVS